LGNDKPRDPVLRNLLTSLSGDIENDPSKLDSDLPPSNDSKTLLTPQKCRARADYIGEDYQYLHARFDDRIIVYGWTGDKENAVAFNEQNCSSGWIPSKYLRNQGLVETWKESFLARQNHASEPQWNQYLEWKRGGGRIRVCYWINRKSFKGVGFNMKTGQIGEFEIHDRNCSIETEG
jgi:hypothetical protein